jgi:NAD(P)-dependent dehydrogenase (short-subunit alcohol dehydrogenase family)
MSAIEGRIVLVTGGGQGIGRAVAGAFLERGDTVWICSRTEERLAEARRHLARYREHLHAVVADVTDPLQVAAMKEDIARRSGRLDVLVNGVGNFRWKGSLDHSLEEWRDIVESNLTSVWLLARAFLPLLRQSSQGRIVTLGAAYGGMMSGFPHFGPYAAAKAAVVSLSKSLAIELAPAGITVNCVNPGMIDTGAYREEVIRKWEKIVPAGRFGDPAEVARVILFLAEPESGYITGAAIPVSGGWEGETP